MPIDLYQTSSVCDKLIYSELIIVLITLASFYCTLFSHRGHPMGFDDRPPYGFGPPGPFGPIASSGPPPWEGRYVDIDYAYYKWNL